MHPDFLQILLEKHFPFTSFALWRSIELRVAVKYLPYLSDPVLDIGCGDGAISKVFFSRRLDAGLDISPRAIRAARALGQYKRLDCGDARMMPYEKESFQSVWSNCVLEHIPGISQVLAEVHRVLRPGGYLLMTVPSEKWHEYLYFYTLFRRFHLGNLGSCLLKIHDRLENIVNIFCPSRWKKLLEANGLKLVTYEYYVSPEAALYITKWAGLIGFVPFPTDHCPIFIRKLASSIKSLKVLQKAELGISQHKKLKDLYLQDCPPPMDGAGLLILACKM